MPNHVHVLWTPLRSLPTLVRQVKGPSALAANRLLGNTGEPFWQSEYFDRQVRNEHEFAKIQRYIEWNPMKAGLVARPEEFPWSSAYTGGRASARAGLQSCITQSVAEATRGLEARPPLVVGQQFVRGVGPEIGLPGG
jgi:hypothetical protein